jgi:long-chain acyl-CoA synthetase
MADHAETIQGLIHSLARHEEKPAIIAFQEDGLATWTYKDFFATVSSLSSGLAKTITGEERTIALCAGNSPQWIMTALAVMYAGGVLLPVDRQAEDETLRHILNDSNAGILFTSRNQAKKIRQLELRHPPRIYHLDSEDNEQSWRSVMTRESWHPSAADPGDRAALFYTSGTTGPPKGVPLSHANLACQPEAIREARLITHDDRVLLPLPLHHVYPFVIGLLTPLALGLPVILPASLTGREVIRAIDDGKASIIIGVPRLYRTLYNGIRSKITARGRTVSIPFASLLFLSRFLRRHFGMLPGKYLFPFIHEQFGPTLRVLASGGSALDARLAENLEGLGWEVAIGYGLTETSPLLTINPPGSGKLQSVGKPVKGVEIRIAGDTYPLESTRAKKREECQIGEVLVRGPNVFTGYHQLEKETEKAFTENGWFRTGDLGCLDNEGFLSLHGRIKTLIITESGKNLQPDEIEEAYARHPVISEIGVFFHNGRLTGIIVPDIKKIPLDGDIKDIIRDAVSEQSGKLPSHKSLEEYVISREALPRTLLGKIRRHLLEKSYAAAKAVEQGDREETGAMPISEMSDHDQALLADKNTEKIWKWLEQRYTDRRLTPDASLRFDLGIDSLEWLNISLEVQQQTGVELTEETIGNIDTIRDLLEKVSSQPQSAKSLDPERPIRDPESVLDGDQKRWLEPLGPISAKLNLVVYHINRILMRSCFGLQVIGRENLPEGKPCLITPNHLSALDPLVVAAALPYSLMRRTFFAGWTGIAFRNVFFRFFSRLARAVPVDSRYAVSSTLAFASAVLGRGSNLIWFPEGRRSRDGDLQEFKPGITLLLAHHDVPVVPIYISGTFDALPIGKKLPRFRKVTVAIGRPVTGEMLQQSETGDTSHQRILHGLRGKIAGLKHDIDRNRTKN